ncbi:MAG: hypothetical protein ACREPF_03015 [Rhodanobacteraceae bacterium]
MKTPTLRPLVSRLTDALHHHLVSALLEPDPARHSQERERAYKAAGALDAIRCELSVRITRNRRTSEDARRATRYLQRYVRDFLELVELDDMPLMPCPAVVPALSPPPGGIAAMGVAGPIVAGIRRVQTRSGGFDGSITASNDP